jgi:glyoxylase-like metal-dependent hydrolase (beta-lactamase superfamily II)
MIKPFIVLDWEMYRVSLLNLGHFALDGGAMFGVVPKAIWHKLMPADDENRIKLATYCLLIEYSGDASKGEKPRKVMVDTGVGVKFSGKYERLYHIEAMAAADKLAGDTPIDLAFRGMGLTVDDITDVVFTHLHFDHAGGGTRWDADGNAQPVFPNAFYHIHQGEWNYANCPHERCKASYLKENLEPILNAANRLVLLKEESTQIIPGLHATVSGGHTPFHLVISLETPHGNLMYWGDLIPTQHHVRIPFVMGYDEYPIETMDKKRELLKQTAQPHYLHVFQHDPDVPVAVLKPGLESGKPDTYCIMPYVGN